jgi:hypothetical protein
LLSFFVFAHERAPPGMGKSRLTARI